jgi:hypothetical protein
LKYLFTSPLPERKNGYSDLDIPQRCAALEQVMAKYLTEDEYGVLQSDLTTRAAKLFVSRSLARQFFINVTYRNVRNLTGVSVLGEKLLVLISLAASLILITACLALAVKDFGWGATFAVPIIGIFWTVIVGFTTESGSVLLSTLLFVPCLILAYFLPEAYSELFGIFATSVYSYRISHIIAQRFLTTLVSSSYKAYNMLEEQIKITRIVAPK